MFDPRVELGADYTATSPRHLQVMEVRALDTDTTRIILPQLGVFYTKTMVVMDTSTGLPLVMGEDYKCRLIDKVASAESGLEATGVLEITNQNITEVALTYQCVGGAHGLNTYILGELLAMYPDGITTLVYWDDIIGAPTEFAPSHHVQNVRTFEHLNDVVIALERIRAALVHRLSPKLKNAYDAAQARFTKLYKQIDDYYKKASDDIQVIIKELRIQEGEYIHTTNPDNPAAKRGYGNWERVQGVILNGQMNNYLVGENSLYSLGGDHVISNVYIWRNLDSKPVHTLRMSADQDSYIHGSIVDITLTNDPPRVENVSVELYYTDDKGVAVKVSTVDVTIPESGTYVLAIDSRLMPLHDVVDKYTCFVTTAVNSAEFELIRPANLPTMQGAFMVSGQKVDMVGEDVIMKYVVVGEYIPLGTDLTLTWDARLGPVLNSVLPDTVKMNSNRAEVEIILKDDGKLDIGKYLAVTPRCIVDGRIVTSPQTKVLVSNVNVDPVGKVRFKKDGIYTNLVGEGSTFQVEVQFSPVCANHTMRVKLDTDRNPNTYTLPPTTVRVNAEGYAAFEVSTTDDRISNAIERTFMAYSYSLGEVKQLTSGLVEVQDKTITPPYKLAFTSDDKGTKPITSVNEGSTFYIAISVDTYDPSINDRLVFGWGLNGEAGNVSSRIVPPKVTGCVYSSGAHDPANGVFWVSEGLLLLRAEAIANIRFDDPTTFTFFMKQEASTSWYDTKDLTINDTSFPKINVVMSSHPTVLTPITSVKEISLSPNAYVWITGDPGSEVYDEFRVGLVTSIPEERWVTKPPQTARIIQAGRPVVFPITFTPDFTSNKDDTIEVIIRGGDFKTGELISNTVLSVLNNPVKGTVSIVPLAGLVTNNRYEYTQFGGILKFAVTGDSVPVATIFNCTISTRTAGGLTPEKFMTVATQNINMGPNTTSVTVDSKFIRNTVVDVNTSLEQRIVVTQKYMSDGREVIVGVGYFDYVVELDILPIQAYIIPPTNPNFSEGVVNNFKLRVKGLWENVALYFINNNNGDDLIADTGNCYLGSNNTKMSGLGWNKKIANVAAGSDIVSCTYEFDFPITVRADRKTNVYQEILAVSFSKATQGKYLSAVVGTETSDLRDMVSLAQSEIPLLDTSKEQVATITISGQAVGGGAPAELLEGVSYVLTANITSAMPGDLYEVIFTDNSRVPHNRFATLQVHPQAVDSAENISWDIVTKSDYGTAQDDGYGEFKIMLAGTDIQVGGVCSFYLKDNLKTGVERGTHQVVSEVIPHSETIVVTSPGMYQKMQLKLNNELSVNILPEHFDPDYNWWKATYNISQYPLDPVTDKAVITFEAKMAENHKVDLRPRTVALDVWLDGIFTTTLLYPVIDDSTNRAILECMWTHDTVPNYTTRTTLFENRALIVDEGNVAYLTYLWTGGMGAEKLILKPINSRSPEKIDPPYGEYIIPIDKPSSTPYVEGNNYIGVIPIRVLSDGMTHPPAANGIDDSKLHIGIYLASEPDKLLASTVPLSVRDNSKENSTVIMDWYVNGVKVTTLDEGVEAELRMSVRQWDAGLTHIIIDEIPGKSYRDKAEWDIYPFPLRVDKLPVSTIPVTIGKLKAKRNGKIDVPIAMTWGYNRSLIGNKYGETSALTIKDTSTGITTVLSSSWRITSHIDKFQLEGEPLVLILEVNDVKPTTELRIELADSRGQNELRTSGLFKKVTHIVKPEVPLWGVATVEVYIETVADDYTPSFVGSDHTYVVNARVFISDDVNGERIHTTPFVRFANNSPNLNILPSSWYLGSELSDTYRSTPLPRNTDIRVGFRYTDKALEVFKAKSYFTAMERGPNLDRDGHLSVERVPTIEHSWGYKFYLTMLSLKNYPDDNLEPLPEVPEFEVVDFVGRDGVTPYPNVRLSAMQSYHYLGVVIKCNSKGAGAYLDYRVKISAVNSLELPGSPVTHFIDITGATPGVYVDVVDEGSQSTATITYLPISLDYFGDIIYRLVDLIITRGDDPTPIYKESITL